MGSVENSHSECKEAFLFESVADQSDWHFSDFRTLAVICGCDNGRNTIPHFRKCVLRASSKCVGMLLSNDGNAGFVVDDEMILHRQISIRSSRSHERRRWPYWTPKQQARIGIVHDVERMAAKGWRPSSHMTQFCLRPVKGTELLDVSGDTWYVESRPVHKSWCHVADAFVHWHSMTEWLYRALNACRFSYSCTVLV